MVGAICHYDVTSEKGTQGTRPRKASASSQEIIFLRKQELARRWSVLVVRATST